VRLANVHRQEVGTILVIIVELDEVNYLAAEWRSGVAAENQHKWALADSVGERKYRLAVERVDAEIRSRLADLEIALAPLRQRVPQEPVDVPRAAHEMAQNAEANAQNQHQREKRPFPPAHTKAHTTP